VSTSPVIRHARRTRAFNLAAVSFSAASALLQVLAFHQVTFWVPVLLVFAAVNVSCAAAGTRNLRRLQAGATRPDYAAITRLERDIWGQAFEHAGAPMPPVPETGRTHAPARGCGGYHLGTEAMCAACNGYRITMTRIGPVGPVCPCCGTTPGTGHHGMNGGTEAGIADLPASSRFPIPSQDVALYLEREIVRHFGIPPAR